MAKFDVEGARRAGYTDAEIADFLAGEEAFDAAAAREAGYTDAEIIGYISGPSTPVKLEPEPDIRTGDTICRMERYSAGREIGICVALTSEKAADAIVVTALIIRD